MPPHIVLSTAHSPTPELASCITLANRRRRFQWQADVSGPGSSGVGVVAPNGCAPDPLDRRKADHPSTNGSSQADPMALDSLGPMEVSHV